MLYPSVIGRCMYSTTMAGVHQTKAVLRKELKARLAKMSPDTRASQSKQIFNKLIQMLEYQSSNRVCLYLHMKEEVYTTDILEHALNSSKECFIPQYIGPKMKMVKLESMEDFNSLPETKWKIKQPADDDARPDALETGGLDVIVMPGLGFSKDGHRIGRGKGYYDTYLAKCNEKGLLPKTIALAYKEQMCESIPTNENDKQVDIVLSPD